MRLLRWLINFVAGTIAAIVTLFFVVSLFILFFKLTGQLTDGPMYFEMQTPSYTGLLLFQAICIAVISACFALRITFGGKNDFPFLSKKHRRNK